MALSRNSAIRLSSPALNVQSRSFDSSICICQVLSSSQKQLNINKGLHNLILKDSNFVWTMYCRSTVKSLAVMHTDSVSDMNGFRSQKVNDLSTKEMHTQHSCLDSSHLQLHASTPQHREGRTKIAFADRCYPTAL